jgi:hypothetical protein
LPPGDLAKSSITDQISFLIPTSMSLRDMDPGGCPHHHSLSVAETWSFSIGITCCYEIQRSVCTTSNRHQISICRCKHFLKESVLSLVICGFLSALPRNVFYEDHTIFYLIDTLRVVGLSCIPHFPYPWETMKGVLTKRFFTFVKNSSKRLGKDLGLDLGPALVSHLRVEHTHLVM